jgi:maltooligosyltrehalose trehalohydrolase
MSRRWTLQRGAAVLDGGKARFSVWAPRVRSLAVRLWRPEAGPDVPLQRGAGGVFEAVVPDVAPGTDYAFVLEGERQRPDPVSRYQPAGVHGPSRIVDPRGFVWSDEGWKGLEAADLVIYELHVGTFAGGGTFGAAAERLPYLRELGITALELMPVAQFPGGRNWGYDGVCPYAPQSTYGGPEGLRRLVDAAHAAGLGVVLDVVYNHLGPEGNYLRELGPYFSELYRTPWGQPLNFDEAGSDEVRRYFIDNARYWIEEYHIDALRLDAVHSIFDFGAIHFLEELAEAVHAQGAELGRRVLLIAESDLNDPRLVRPAARGGFGLDAQWSDDFHHAVHALLSGERDGYYADFGGIGPLHKVLRDRFVYDGIYSPHRDRRHGAPAGDVPADRFVVCVQNHDQVGNRACGERLSALIPFERQKLAASLLLLSPYVPLLFMGEEYGETRPFLYFVSHGDPELVEAVRRGRRNEFRHFDWAGEVPDPQAEETFLRSRLQPELASEGPHAALFRLYRDLLRLRRQEPALRPGTASVQVQSDAQAGWLALLLRPEAGASILSLFNLSGQPQKPELAQAALDWTCVLFTDEIQYGGSGARPERPEAAGAGAARFALPPASAAVYRSEVNDAGMAR